MNDWWRFNVGIKDWWYIFIYKYRTVDIIIIGLQFIHPLIFVYSCLHLLLQAIHPLTFVSHLYIYYSRLSSSYIRLLMFTFITLSFIHLLTFVYLCLHLLLQAIHPLTFVYSCLHLLLQAIHPPSFVYSC